MKILWPSVKCFCALNPGTRIPEIAGVVNSRVDSSDLCIGLCNTSLKVSGKEEAGKGVIMGGAVVL